MKISCLFFLLFPMLVLGQNNPAKKVYLDSLYQRTNQKNYAYYKVSEILEDGTIESKTFDKNNRLKHLVRSADTLSLNFYESIRYYDNGNKKVHSIRNGSYTIERFFHENGIFAYQPRTLMENGKSKPIITQYYDKDGNQTVIDGEGTCIIDDGDCETSGKIIKGVREGEWSGRVYKTGHTFKDQYQNGVIVSGELTDENGKIHKYKSPLEVPSPGTKFSNYVLKNFRKPKGIPASGTVLMNFIVGKNGRPYNIKVIRGLHPVIDDEAIRIVQSYRYWEPGKMRGVPMDIGFTLPLRIDFRN